MGSFFTPVPPGCWIVPGLLQVRALLRLASRASVAGERFGREVGTFLFPKFLEGCGPSIELLAPSHGYKTS